MPAESQLTSAMVFLPVSSFLFQLTCSLHECHLATSEPLKQRLHGNHLSPAHIEEAPHSKVQSAALT